MDMEDLIGTHVLSGFDRENIDREIWGHKEDSETVWVLIDGQCYEFWENPNDGYRSTHEGPVKSSRTVQNTFEPIEVVIAHKEHYQHGECDTLEFISTNTGKTVLTVGTLDIDDYYPAWFCGWTPENLK